MTKVCFLCGHNTGRSVAGERLLKRDAPGLRIFSAGTKAGLGGLANPNVLHALLLHGINADDHVPLHIEQVDFRDVDVVIAMCADGVCPTLPGFTGERIDWSDLPDPFNSDLHAAISVVGEIEERVMQLVTDRNWA